MPSVPPKKPTVSANLAEQLGAARKPAISRELVDSLLPPVPAPSPAPIVINLAAGAVLHLHVGAVAKKEE